MEMVMDLSAEELLQAMQRHFSHAGLPKRIYCDRGTNLVRSKTEIEVAIKSFNSSTKVKSALIKDEIEFILNPPYSPHRNSAVERLVKMCKTSLKRTFGTSLLSFLDLLTQIKVASAAINERPLIAYCSEDSDIDVVTPSKLQLARPRKFLPPYFDFVPGQSMPIAARWEIRRELSQQFWASFLKQFVPSLQERARWMKASKDPIRKNDVVLIVDQANRKNPHVWPLAVVTEVHRSRDGKIRTATLRTKGEGMTSRAIQYIAPLEGENLDH